MHHVAAPPILPDRANDQGHDAEDDEERKQGNPERELDVVMADAHGVVGVDRSEHGNQVTAHSHVFLQVDEAEEAYQVVADLGIVFGRNFAEEIDHVVVGMAGDVDLAKEDDNVSVDVALNVDVAKEADCVVGRLVGSDVNVLKEMAVVGVGTGGNGGSREGSAQQDRDKDSLEDHVRLCNVYAERRGKVPGTSPMFTA